MRKFIKFADGERVEISPFTDREFSCLELWQGADDIAYNEWLRFNKFHEANSFNDDSLKGAIFETEAGEPVMWFRLYEQLYGQDAWVHFDRIKSIVAQTHKLGGPDLRRLKDDDCRDVD